MTRFKILAGALLALVVGAAQAAEKFHDHHGFGPSIEHAAMHNIMAGLIATKTGRTEAEVRGLFEAGDPHDAADKLGLSRDDMHALMMQAHETLLTRATAAGLITAEQAAKIRAMPMPAHDGSGHDRPPPGDR